MVITVVLVRLVALESAIFRICSVLGMMRLLQNTSPIDKKMVLFLLLEHFVTN